MLVHRAEEAGFRAICLTVDTPAPSPKERDIRNAYVRGHELGNFRGLGRAENEISGTDETQGWDVARAAPITWRELEWLRSLTQLPLVLKGIRTAEDAHMAVENGVNGILVSTHGGRQMDMTMGAIEMLPEVVEAAKGQAEVYLDSGVRRGSDVNKGISLGCPCRGHRTPPVLGLGRRWRRGSTRCPRATAGRGGPGHGLLRPDICPGPRACLGQHPLRLGPLEDRPVDTISKLAAAHLNRHSREGGNPDFAGKGKATLKVGVAFPYSVAAGPALLGQSLFPLLGQGHTGHCSML